MNGTVFPYVQDATGVREATWFGLVQRVFLIGVPLPAMVVLGIRLLRLTRSVP